MPRMKGGELIAEFLVRENITHVFGLCGHGNVGMLDPLAGVADKLTLISPRHEQTAGHMADAYFRVKHAPAATLTSCGPGSANMVMALANAYLDSSAIFAITANVPTQQFNRAPFQELYRQKEADFPAVCRPVVKRAFQPVPNLLVQPHFATGGDATVNELVIQVMNERVPRANGAVRPFDGTAI